MQIWEAAAIAVAGAAAGALNAAVGSGTLITFPVLLGLGYPPVVANICNGLGLIPGSLSGAWGYRREIAAAGRAARYLMVCSALGAALGAVALLVLPAAAFDAVVPALVLLAVVLVVLQPWLGVARTGSGGSRRLGLGLVVGVLLAGVYGGYFGAAQGVLLIGLLGWLFTASLQEANGVKNLLSAVVNAVSAAVFVIVAGDRVDWTVVGLIALGAGVGGLAGAELGRRAPAPVLRTVIVVVGLSAVVHLLAR